MVIKCILWNDRASGIELEKIMMVVNDISTGMLLHLLIVLVRRKGMLFPVRERTDSYRCFQMKLSQHGTVVNKLLTTSSVQLQEC